MDKKIKDAIDTRWGYGMADYYERVESSLQGTREEKDEHLKRCYGIGVCARHQEIRKILNGEEPSEEDMCKVVDGALSNILR